MTNFFIGDIIFTSYILKEKTMKKFFAEFKKFITRGNVVDMAVGVIVGSAFTAIVNGLSNNILKPVINWLLSLIFGKDSLSEIYTFLTRVEVDGVVDLTQSIYIDWGAFINAVINFFIVAFVLFTIVKLVNRFRDEQKKITDKLINGKLTREDKKELRRRGIKLIDREAIAAYLVEKAQKEAEAKALAEAEAAEKARIEREQNPTVEDLLKEIRDLLKAKSE